MWDVFGYSKNTSEGYEGVRSYITYGDGIRKLGSILDSHNFIFDGEKQLQDFINLIMIAKNNTRIWENNGYTPSELHEIISKRNENIVKFPTLQRPQIGRNDPCPCGSVKKYKKCCAMVDDTKSAQLNSDECRLFYETWYGLMGFVNERMGVIKAKIKPEYPNTVSDMMVHKVREVLWKKPELIDEYINETELPQEKIDILKLWRTKHKKGMLFILEYRPEYAVVLASDEQGEDRLYGIKGVSNSVANTLRRDLPAQIETVLLPFKGKIIYDSFISSMPIGFGEGAKFNSAVQQGSLEKNYCPLCRTKFLDIDKAFADTEKVLSQVHDDGIKRVNDLEERLIKIFTVLEILKIIRFLRERGINMRFENEKLNSIKADEEFEITREVCWHRTKAGIPARIFNGISA